jgi:hypothetical protein
VSGLLQANANRMNMDSGLGPTSEDVSTFEPVDTTPATSGELLSALFPSDAGGVGYLFGHGLLDAAPTPLEEIPVDSPSPAANAMNASAEHLAANVYSTHEGVPDGGPIDDYDVTQNTAVTQAAPANGGAFGRVVSSEWKRIRDQLTIER